MILAEGYLGLSMDRLAEEAEYSKGTIYQHFSSKEDLILAMAARSMEDMSALFRRAALFKGRTRERFTAVGVASEIFFKRYPENPHVERIIHAKSLWNKTSEKWQERYGVCGKCCFDIALSIIQEAIECGDLSNERLTPFEILQGVRSMAHGMQMLATTPDEVMSERYRDPFILIRKTQQIYLDGVRWHPLSIDWDYSQTIQRILTEVFPDESDIINQS